MASIDHPNDPLGRFLADVEVKGKTIQASPAESLDIVPVPSAIDLSEVHTLSSHVARLEQELDLARLQLRDAWARVPFDPSVLRKPYRSDIAVTCRVCGKPTFWRTARGLAEHVPECPTRDYIPRLGRKVSDDVWGILSGLDGSENDENLDDD